MQKYSSNIADPRGNAFGYATVTVLDHTGALATLYSDNGVTLLKNPLTSDALSNFSFYAANGRYSWTASGNGFTTDGISDFVLFDPADAPGVDASALAAQGGAATVGNTPAGGITSTTVQAALNELDTKKAAASQVATNTSNIAANTSALANKANSADLAAAGGAALVGTSDGSTVQAKLTSQASNIATNTSNISSNTTAIAAKVATADLAANGGAGLVGWLMSATGAVKRWLSDILLDRVSVRTWTGDSIDGVTSNQAGIAAAVAYCYANGKELHWPAGTYVSDANIPNFHDITHTGNGVVKRGTDTWKVSGKTGTNILYVATTGSATNDGLSAAQPLTLAQSFLAIQQWGAQLLQPGIFKIQLAAGTYDGVPRIYGLRSRQRIQICGPDVGGHPNVPTAIIDGTGSAQQNGMYFQQYMYVYVQDIKFTNWTTISDSNGLSVDQHCNLQTKNVHTANCAYGGINAQSMSYLYMEGGIHNNANYSIRIYSGCTFSIGYNGGATANRPQISGARGGYAGIVIYNSSAGHIDHCDIFDCAGSGGGVQIVNQSRVDFVDTAFGAGTANYYNIRMDASSTYIDNGITFNAATARSVAAFGGSMSNAKQPYMYFDEATGNWRMGASTSLTPQALLHLKNTDATTVGYNSSVLLALESSTSPYLAFGTNGGATEGGIMWAKTGQSVQGKFYYNYNDDTVRMLVGASANTYKWGATYYAAPVDVTTDLGSTAYRWKTLYAQNVLLYPPASVTPTTNGQMTFQLTSDTSLAIKVKGSDGVVRSASLTLA